MRKNSGILLVFALLMLTLAVPFLYGCSAATEPELKVVATLVHEMFEKGGGEIIEMYRNITED